MTRMTLISMVIIAAALVGLCSVAPAASAREVPPKPLGGYRPIQNVNDPHIQELGRWAVSEHDKQTSDGLFFSKVVSGDEQVVAGMKYKLVIQATKGSTGKSATYVAVVWEKAWEKIDKTLLSFNPVN